MFNKIMQALVVTAFVAVVGMVGVALYLMADLVAAHSKVEHQCTQ